MPMIWNIKKFNREIESLKELGRQTDALRPEEQGRIKQAVLLAIAKQPLPAPSVREKAERFLQSLKLAISVLLGLSLVGGTVFASGSSKPGDLLYPVKIATEKTRLSLAFSQTTKVTLQTEFAIERLKELREISAGPKPAAGLSGQQNKNQFLSATSSGAAGFSAGTTTKFSNSGQNDKQRQIEMQAKIEAGVEIKNALDALRKAKGQMQSKGDAKNAEKMNQNILNLEERAAEQNIIINLPTNKLENNREDNYQAATGTSDSIKKEPENEKSFNNKINFNTTRLHRTNVSLATSTGSPFDGSSSDHE